MLSRKAQKLYDAITARGGGIVDEYLIRDMTGLSHGSIVAARHELIDAGLLTLSKTCRKMVYHLTGQLTRPQSEPAPSPATIPVAPAALVWSYRSHLLRLGEHAQCIDKVAAIDWYIEAEHPLASEKRPLLCREQHYHLKSVRHNAVKLCGGHIAHCI